MSKKRPSSRSRSGKPAATEKGRLRIVGGQFRGRAIDWHGDRETRPMKDRTREAVFNILGPLPPTTSVVDLFAGTGALGIEAISRGAAAAELFETSAGALATIGENVERLGIGDRVTLRQADAFRRAKRSGDEGGGPWLWFCCPPYRLVELRRDDFLEMIGDFARRAPEGSRYLFEVEEHEDLAWLPFDDAWDKRHYPPARVSILDVDRIGDRIEERPSAEPPSASPEPAFDDDTAPDEV